jgi:hypothetical protein
MYADINYRLRRKTKEPVQYSLNEALLKLDTPTALIPVALVTHVIAPGYVPRGAA